MNSKTCLNCDQPVYHKFCANCGQKTDTHRITAKHFVLHDVVHGVWHIDKGILYTLKNVFIRPGHAALDYINGKRIRYYNVFYLVVLLLGLYMFASGHGDLDIEKLKNTTYSGPAVAKIFTVYTQYFKYFLLILIPLLATGALVAFQRLKLNFIEHLIIVGFASSGSVTLLLLSALVANFSGVAAFLLIVSSLFYLVRAYYQATLGLYTFLGFAWRIIFLYFIAFTLYSFLLGTLLINTILNN